MASVQRCRRNHGLAVRRGGVARARAPSARAAQAAQRAPPDDRPRAAARHLRRRALVSMSARGGSRPSLGAGASTPALYGSGAAVPWRQQACSNAAPDALRTSKGRGGGPVWRAGRQKQPAPHPLRASKRERLLFAGGALGGPARGAGGAAQTACSVRSPSVPAGAGCGHTQETRSRCLTKWSHPTRLVTRIKESNMRASREVANLHAQ